MLCKKPKYDKPYSFIYEISIKINTKKWIRLTQSENQRENYSTSWYYVITRHLSMTIRYLNYSTNIDIVAPPVVYKNLPWFSKIFFVQSWEVQPEIIYYLWVQQYQEVSR